MNQKRSRYKAKPPRDKRSKRRDSHHTSAPARSHRHEESIPVSTEVPTVFEALITVISDDGEPFAVATDRDLAGVYPRLLIDPTANVKVGDTVTVEVFDEQEGTFLANVLTDKQKTEEDNLYTFLGLFYEYGAYGGVRAMHRDLASVDFVVEDAPNSPPNPGDIVRVMPGKRPTKGATPVTIVENMGANPQGIESQIAIENHNIPQEFPSHVLADADMLKPTLTKEDITKREDLRDVPIVTIDGADSRDFDDAVWAERTKDGYHIIVAIADVAHYVQEKSKLDNEAFERGNSTYFPDQVIPMLPERLSNDLCSLRPNEDRPVLAVHMWINNKGQLIKQKFVRGIIHSHARLTYVQAQAALNGEATTVASYIIDRTLRPLYEAYKVLLTARQKRGTFDLDIPEPYLLMDDKGTITELAVRDRLDTHKLIEEMMILANVAAATALETKGAPCLYRVHPEPSNEKMTRLKAVLGGHGFMFTDSPTQYDYQKLVKQVAGHEAASVLMRNILQSQQQAKYDQDNIGHYGLALHRYAHFTSPIRRYSDLIVHRSLIQNLGLAGKGGLTQSKSQIHAVADHINVTERRSQQAEWEARDRLMAKFYTDYIGKEFEANVMTVAKFGCFVSIDQVAEGLVPARLMKDGYYVFIEKELILKGKRTKKIIKAGMKLKVKLIEANRANGKLTFTLANVQKKSFKEKRGFGAKKRTR